MSGSSLDGLDIACVQLTEIRGAWTYELLASDCVPYDADWMTSLKKARELSVPDFLKLHTAYGHYLGNAVNTFIAANGLEHKIHFIASHGHTILHEPADKTTFQIGDGAAIAAITELPAITDLRNVDVALGGQGAPIVPIGDKLLFGNYDFLLNLGGIANISVKEEDGSYIAFDICPCNQLLNALAGEAGQDYDADGAIAATGTSLPQLQAQLDAIIWYSTAPPKSLSNEFATGQLLPLLKNAVVPLPDRMATADAHIIAQIKEAIAPHLKPAATMLITGGGAFNTHLIAGLTEALEPHGVTLTVPDAATVTNKEAIVMALIGALRWREEENVLAAVTGATRSSIGGALWKTM